MSKKDCLGTEKKRERGEWDILLDYRKRKGRVEMYAIYRIPLVTGVEMHIIYRIP